MNKSVLLWYKHKQAIPAGWIRVKQEFEFNIFAKAGDGAGVKLFGVGVKSESKNLNSDHLCPKAQ